MDPTVISCVWEGSGCSKSKGITVHAYVASTSVAALASSAFAADLPVSRYEQREVYEYRQAPPPVVVTRPAPVVTETVVVRRPVVVAPPPVIVEEYPVYAEPIYPRVYATFGGYPGRRRAHFGWGPRRPLWGTLVMEKPREGPFSSVWRRYRVAFDSRSASPHEPPCPMRWAQTSKD
jgi:hypothetical protein